MKYYKYNNISMLKYFKYNTIMSLAKLKGI